jgi:hypothetical protein
LSITSNQAADLTTLHDDIVTLKHDVAGLLEHLKPGATNSAQRTVSRIDDGSRRLYRDVTSEGGRAAKAVARRIEREPMLALLILLGVGYIGGRLLSR